MDKAHETVFLVPLTPGSTYPETVVQTPEWGRLNRTNLVIPKFYVINTKNFLKLQVIAVIRAER